MRVIEILYPLLRRVVVVALAFSATSAALASSVPRAKASLDSVQILMGRKATLDLEIVQTPEQTVRLPLLETGYDRPYVAVCGDSVEISRAVVRDTTRLGSGLIQVNWKLGVQAFDSGFYAIPGLLVVAGPDSVTSNGVNLKVVPVAAKADDPIADYAPIAEPDGMKWTDNLPDWLYYYWWIGLGALAMGAALGWYLWRRSKGRPIVPKPSAPPVDPEVEALRRLEALKERRLWEKGMEKEYFTELTDILRRYLQRRFGINAMEMTSRQIMDRLRQNPETASKRGMVRQILDMADFVKFAKVRPLPADNVKALENAFEFVRQTTPEANADTSSEPDSVSQTSDPGIKD